MNRMYFTPPWTFASSWLMSPTFSSFPVAGMICMIADRADMALRAVVEPGLLEALRDHQQVVDVVLVAVLAEEVDDLAEPADLVGRRPRSSRTSGPSRSG